MVNHPWKSGGFDEILWPKHPISCKTRHHTSGSQAHNVVINQLQPSSQVPRWLRAGGRFLEEEFPIGNSSILEIPAIGFRAFDKVGHRGVLFPNLFENQTRSVMYLSICFGIHPKCLALRSTMLQRQEWEENWTCAGDVYDHICLQWEWILVTDLPLAVCRIHSHASKTPG